ncbi:MAG: HAD hydrolase family protein [Candidatus Gastranaerophilaceae bacterium]
MKNNLELKAIAGKIKLVAFDIDGVMTDGSLTFDENGVEYKTYNSKDGLGVIMLSRAGIIPAIITARNNGTVVHRAKILGITELYQGQKNKISALEELLEKYNLTYAETAYMGDDLPDLCVLEKVGLPCCPADAVEDVLAASKFISAKGGGKGAVRELCEFILKSQSVDLKQKGMVSVGRN